MTDNTKENNNMNDGNGDNLSPENEQLEEQIGSELNVDDSVSGMQHLDDDIDTESESEQLRKELNEMKDKYLRLVAEFDNFRKRNAKERLEMAALAGRDVIQPLLEVLDDSERAEKQMETITDVAVLKEGVMLVFNKLRHTMQQRGLKKMEAINQPFDADLHEAITEIPAPTEEQKGKVFDVIEPGYYLNDKIIRHAKVVVGK